MTNVHARTPNILAVDGRGLPVRQVAYLRSEASVAAVALIARQPVSYTHLTLPTKA